MASRLSRIFPFLVITLCCIGAVEGGYSVLEYFLTAKPAQEDASPEAPAVGEKAAPVPSGGQRDYSIILSRNLFGQQYKSQETQPAQAVDVAANLEKSGLDVVLVGTVGGSAGTQRAIIYDKKTKKQELYKEGDAVKGASIKEILRGKVVLDAQGKEELLDMSEAATLRPAVRAPQETASAGSPAPAVAGLGAGPELRPEPPPAVPVTTEVMPGAEGTAAPANEMAQPTDAPQEETMPPAAGAPEPQASSTQPPPQDQGSQVQNVVRPRIIRPYRQ